MRRDKQTKSIEGWFNKPVFFSMAALTLASSLTACSSLGGNTVIDEYASVTDISIIKSTGTILLECTITETIYRCHVRDK